MLVKKHRRDLSNPEPHLHSAWEGGTSKWSEFGDWAAGQPTMAPGGQLEYDQDKIRSSVRTICDDIAKKARKSRLTMWEAIHLARGTYRTANPKGPKTIQSSRSPLPGAGELGGFKTGPAYMQRKSRGRVGAGLVSATMESNEERKRVEARDYSAMFLPPHPQLPPYPQLLWLPQQLLLPRNLEGSSQQVPPNVQQ